MIKRMNKTMAHLLLIISILMGLAGCEFKDIDKRFFVLAVGIDRADDPQTPFDVTIKVAIPTQHPKMGEETFQIFEQKASTISEAVQYIKAKVDKELDFGHVKALIFGEKLMQDDFRESLDWCIRQRYIQKIAWCAVGVPNAKSVVVQKIKSERLPSNALVLSFGKTGVESQFITSKLLADFSRSSNEVGYDTVLPVVVPKKEYIQIDHSVVVNQSKIAVQLTREETKLYNVLGEKIEKSDWKINLNKNFYLVHVDSVDVGVKLNPNSNPIQIQVHVKMDGLVEEIHQKVSISDPILRDIGTGLERQVESKSLKFLKKMQRGNVDPLGFGMIYRSKKWDPVDAEIAAWKRLYPKAVFRVTAKVNIRTLGVID